MLATRRSASLRGWLALMQRQCRRRRVLQAFHAKVRIRLQLGNQPFFRTASATQNILPVLLARWMISQAGTASAGCLHSGRVVAWLASDLSSSARIFNRRRQRQPRKNRLSVFSVGCCRARSRGPRRWRPGGGRPASRAGRCGSFRGPSPSFAKRGLAQIRTICACPLFAKTAKPEPNQRRNRSGGKGRLPVVGVRAAASLSWSLNPTRQTSPTG